MAEPLILAYGRGELPEFPAAADTIVDIVPGRPRGRGDRRGARAPARGRRRRRTSTSRPVRATRSRSAGSTTACAPTSTSTRSRSATAAPPGCPTGASRARRASSGCSSTSERAHKVADYVIGHAPAATRTRDLARKLDQQGRRLEFLRRYLDLYREYAEAELRFDDAHTLALYREPATPSDRERVRVRHRRGRLGPLPARGALPGGHRADPPARRGAARAAQGPEARLKTLEPPTGEQVAAFFDMDGTLLSSNVDRDLPVAAAAGPLAPAERASEIGRIAARLPGLVRAERRERSAFLRAIYREYDGARLADLDEVVDDVLTDHVLARLAPAAVRRVREHRAAGHTTVLITGAIRPLTRPLAPLFDHIEAAELGVDDRGRCTGFLAASPLVGESRAAWMREWSRRERHRPGDVATATPTATPTCRCWPRSATRWPSGPTSPCSAMPGGSAGRSSTGPARPRRRGPSTPRECGR